MDVSVVERSSCVETGKGGKPPDAGASSGCADACRRCHQLATLLRGTHRTMVALAIAARVDADPVLALLIETNDKALADPLFEGTFQFLRREDHSLESHSEGAVLHDRRGAVIVIDARLIESLRNAIQKKETVQDGRLAGEFARHADVEVGG